MTGRRLLAAVAVLAAMSTVTVAPIVPAGDADAAWGCKRWSVTYTYDGVTYVHLKGSCDHLDSCEDLRVKARFYRYSDGVTFTRSGDVAYDSGDISTLIYRPSRWRLLDWWLSHPCYV